MRPLRLGERSAAGIGIADASTAGNAGSLAVIYPVGIGEAVRRPPSSPCHASPAGAGRGVSAVVAPVVVRHAVPVGQPVRTFPDDLPAEVIPELRLDVVGIGRAPEHTAAPDVAGPQLGSAHVVRGVRLGMVPVPLDVRDAVLDHVAVILFPLRHSVRHLLHVVQTARPFSCFPRSSEGRHQHGCQNGDDCHHHQQFNQSKSRSPSHRFPSRLRNYTITILYRPSILSYPVCNSFSMSSPYHLPPKLFVGRF